MSLPGIKYRYEHFKKRVSATISVAAIKRQIKGWSAIEFGDEAKVCSRC